MSEDSKSPTSAAIDALVANSASTHTPATRPSTNMRFDGETALVDFTGDVVHGPLIDTGTNVTRAEVIILSHPLTDRTVSLYTPETDTANPLGSTYAPAPQIVVSTD